MLRLSGLEHDLCSVWFRLALFEEAEELPEPEPVTPVEEERNPFAPNPAVNPGLAVN